MSDGGSKVCRLCLVEVQVVCPIFGDNVSPQSVALPERIMSCAQIKVIEGDGLPASICHRCLAQVDNSYQFKLQCEKSDAMLRKTFQENDLTISIKTNNGIIMNGSGLLTSLAADNITLNKYNNGNNRISDNDIVNHRNAVDVNEDVDDDDDDDYDDDNDDDDEDCGDEPEHKDSDVDDEDGVSVAPGAIGDTESVDGWEVMKFTPEVIINEEDSKGSDSDVPQGEAIIVQNSPHGVLRNINSLAEQQLYQLSQVEAILRNHGTEIKVQASNGSLIGNGQSHLLQKLSQQQLATQTVAQANSNSTTGDQYQLRTLSLENNSANGDYFPMYGVEAVLDDSDSGPSAKTRRSRDGEKLFKCRLCPKSYSFSSALSRHKAVHNTMLRPYVCPICKKGFTEPEKLERHSRTHLVDRTWRCNNCGRIFKALNTYERHITTICSYRNKENGGSPVQLPPGLTAHPVNIMPQTVMYRNS